LRIQLVVILNGLILIPLIIQIMDTLWLFGGCSLRNRDHSAGSLGLPLVQSCQLLDAFG
jgi:hypothetical protein